MRIFARFVALTALTLAAGCGVKTEFVPMNSPPHALVPRAAEQVEMFSAARPTRPFVEVGTIEVQQRSGSAGTASTVLGAMRAEAGRRGCDGLIVLGDNDKTVVSGTSSTVGGYGHGTVSSETLKGYRGSCIVYVDAPAAAPSASPPVAPPPVAPATSASTS